MKLIKIKKIKKLKNKQDVYDLIDVCDNHNFIANNMVVHNCDLFGRGVGAIYVKNRNPSMDSWCVKDFAKLGNYSEFTELSKVESILKKHGNFWKIIKFPKPSEKLYSKYLEVREKNVYDDDSVMSNVSKEDVHNALLILSLRDILLNDDTLTVNRIILHIRNEYDINITKQVVQAAIEDAKQLVLKIRERAEVKT